MYIIAIAHFVSDSFFFLSFMENETTKILSSDKMLRARPIFIFFNLTVIVFFKAMRLYFISAFICLKYVTLWNPNLQNK